MWRYLDIDKGIGGVNFADKDGTLYTRRYFASAPDGVVAARYTAQGANKLHLCFSLVPGDELHADNATYAADGTGTFNGKLQTIYHNALMKVIPVGGTLRATADGIEVDGASEVILLLCGGTSFDSSVPARTSGDAAQLADRVKGIVDAAAAKSWDELLNAHVANFTSFMGRVDFQITPNPSKKNTEDLVKFYSGSQNNKNLGRWTLPRGTLFPLRTLSRNFLQPRCTTCAQQPARYLEQQRTCALEFRRAHQYQCANELLARRTNQSQRVPRAFPRFYHRQFHLGRLAQSRTTLRTDERMDRLYRK